MRAQRERDTAPEVRLRRELHRRGLRYRLHRRVVPGTRREVDIVFTRQRVAVDVRGCFWHGCPLHATQPAANAEWWAAKLARNQARDHDTVRRLTEDGWAVFVVWECEAIERAADRIERTVRGRSH